MRISVESLSITDFNNCRYQKQQLFNQEEDDHADLFWARRVLGKMRLNVTNHHIRGILESDFA